jgi:SAM-dependent methyltransferase
VTAVDIRPLFLSYARSRHEKGNIRFVEANVMDKPPLGEFDLVFANQIIEHLVYPVDFIRALKGYLGPGGVLVLTTPNQQYVRCGLPRYGDLGDPAQYESKQFSAGGGDHFFAYTAEELQGFLADAGLQVEDSFFFESPWISGHMKFRYLQRVLPAAVLGIADRITLATAGRRLAHQLCVVGARPQASPRSERT